MITLRHGRRASLAEIVQIVGPRLDLNDYAAYNLPKESTFKSIFRFYLFYSLVLQHATHQPLPQRQPNNAVKQDSGVRITVRKRNLT